MSDSRIQTLYEIYSKNENESSEKLTSFFLQVVNVLGFVVNVLEPPDLGALVGDDVLRYVGVLGTDVIVVVLVEAPGPVDDRAAGRGQEDEHQQVAIHCGSFKLSTPTGYSPVSTPAFINIQVRATDAAWGTNGTAFRHTAACCFIVFFFLSFSLFYRSREADLELKGLMGNNDLPTIFKLGFFTGP